jgi:hypothetical protein
MPAFSVVVPFEPVIHETLDSRVFTNIPDTDLAVGIQIRRGESGYLAELQLEPEPHLERRWGRHPSEGHGAVRLLRT